MPMSRQEGRYRRKGPGRSSRCGCLRRSFLPVVVTALIVLLPGPVIGGSRGTEELAIRRLFRIPSRPLLAALRAFALETGYSFGFPGLDLKGLKSSPVEGRMSLEEALRRLLQGTGLTFSLHPEHVIILHRKNHDMPPRRPAVRSVATTAEPPAIEEIRVIASKRAVPRARLPGMTTVLSSSVIDSFSIRDLQQLSSFAIGLTPAASENAQAGFFVRGISNGLFSGRTRSAVAVYLDDTPVNYIESDPQIRFFDVARIELLEGPQGTLYGAGSLSGVLRIATRRPDVDRPEGSVVAGLSTTDGGSIGRHFEALANVPLRRGRDAIRLGGFIDRRAGFLDNVTLMRRNANWLRVRGLRTAFRHEGDATTMDVDVDFQSLFQPDASYANIVPRQGPPSRRATAFLEPRRRRFLRIAFTLHGGLGRGEWTSNTSYVDREEKIALDASASATALGFPAIPLLFSERRKSQRASHEIRFHLYPASGLDLLVGLFARWRNAPDKELFLPFGRADGGRMSRLLTEKSIETASYAEVEWQAAERLSVTAGLRVAYDHLSARTLADSLNPSAPMDEELTRDSLHLSPKVAFEIRAAACCRVYALLSQGFRTGSLNLNTPENALVRRARSSVAGSRALSHFLGDHLWNAEIGLRASNAAGRLHLDLAVFQISWRNIQTDQFLDNGLLFSTNAGRARIIGAELRATATLGTDFLAGLSGMYSVPELRSGNAFLSSVAGDRLPGASEWSVGGLVEKSWELGSDSVNLAADFRVFRKAPLLFNEQESPQIGGFLLVNGRATWRHDPFKVMLFMDNVLNSGRRAFPFGNPFAFRSETELAPWRPRRFGLTVTWMR